MLKTNGYSACDQIAGYYMTGATKGQYQEFRLLAAWIVVNKKQNADESIPDAAVRYIRKWEKAYRDGSYDTLIAELWEVFGVEFQMLMPRHKDITKVPKWGDQMPTMSLKNEGVHADLDMLLKEIDWVLPVYNINKFHWYRLVVINIWLYLTASWSDMLLKVWIHKCISAEPQLVHGDTTLDKAAMQLWKASGMKKTRATFKTILGKRPAKNSLEKGIFNQL